MPKGLFFGLKQLALTCDDVVKHVHGYIIVEIRRYVVKPFNLVVYKSIDVVLACFCIKNKIQRVGLGGLRRGNFRLPS